MRHVLIAEDHPDIRRLLVRIFERQGWNATAVETGDGALDACLQDAPDVLVLDISTPGDRDGLDVTRELRSHPPTAQMPIVLLTARVQTRDVQVGLAAGANAYLMKPFAPAEVLRVVQGLVADE